MTVRVKDAMNEVNPLVDEDTDLRHAIVKMTEFGFGAVTVVTDGSIKGVFTDGDLRRLLQKDGENILDKKLSDLSYKPPVSIDANALLNDAAGLFKQTNVDTILVTEKGRPVGMIDIQDLKND
jgi:signal-transduction protein with cAMP-binding, CBS, and nucleotidyltransferase domain